MPDFYAPGDSLAAAKGQAEAYLCDWLDAQAFAITGRVPRVERLTWDTKEVAAKAHKEATASAAQTDFLSREASVANETLDTLADRVLANASAFRKAGPLISGVRRAGFASIAAAITLAEVEAAVAAAQAQFQTALAA